MPEARILPDALNDLDQIWLYIARDNIEAAQRLIDEIETTARKLARMPGMGRRRDELEEGLRSFPVGQYIVLYRKTSRGIDVVHMYHGARKMEELFRGGQ